MGNLSFVDHTGKVFHQLTVIERAGSDGVSATWLCRCECGGDIVVPARRLVSGGTKSCGCRKVAAARLVNRKHGMQATLAYKRWESIKQRCFNPKNPSYKNYGGRGITMCPAWVDSFLTFFADVGECPPGMSLDRINNDGNYEPGNVRWASRSEQQRNRRQTTRVTRAEYDAALAEIERLKAALGEV